MCVCITLLFLSSIVIAISFWIKTPKRLILMQCSKQQTCHTQNVVFISI